MRHGLLQPLWAPGAAITEADIISEFVAPLSIDSNQPAYAQDAMNLKRNASSQEIQRFEITTNLAPTNNSAKVMLHKIRNGIVKKFHTTMPQVHGLDIPATERQLTVTALRGSTLLNVSGPMVEGEFINIGIDTKVYAVLSSSGTQIEISPKLQLTTNGGATIRRGRNTSFFCRYDKDTQLGIKYVDGVLSDPGSVKLIEAL